MAEYLRRLRKGLIDGGNRTLITGLLDDLLEENILNDAEVEYINKENTVSSERMRELIDTVRRKGDKSCNIMIQKVTIRDPKLSEKLGITAPSELPLPLQEQVDPPIQKDINGITLCSQEEYQRICSVEGNNKYKILPPNERTRHALIICNDKFENCNLKERHGAEFDVNGMEKLLEGLGYKVLKRTNLKVEEMRDTMKQFAANQEHVTSDSTFIVFMSHGQRDVICGTDTQITLNKNSEEEANNVLHVDEIFTTFNNVNCPGLRDKPKVIIIQACRGRDRSQVWVGDSACSLPSVVQENFEEDAMRLLQKERDFICFCSTTPDTVSWRDPKRGSLFILRLIEHMKKDAHRYSIEDIFRNVQHYFKDNIQMPTQERKTLLKKFYLFPGH